MMELQRVPRNTVTSLEGPPRSLLQLKRALCTPNHLEMKANSHSSIGEESRCSTHTRNAALCHMLKLEKNPEVSAITRKDIMLPLSST